MFERKVVHNLNDAMQLLSDGWLAVVWTANQVDEYRFSFRRELPKGE